MRHPWDGGAGFLCVNDPDRRTPRSPEKQVLAPGDKCQERTEHGHQFRFEHPHIQTYSFTGDVQEFQGDLSGPNPRRG